MVKSTQLAVARKATPAKPTRPKGFPLFAHQTGRWAKKVRGKLVYFGKLDDPQAALAKWLDQKDDLLAGRTPRVSGDGLTVRDLVNKFLNSKRLQVESGELTARSWGDYHSTCERVVSVFGRTRLVTDLAADDFEKLRAEISKTRAAVSLGNEVQRTRTVFKYGYEAGLIEKPVRYGPAFKKPSARVLRQERNGKGIRMFEAAELRRIIAAAGVPLKAMILLGINCGFGNHDVGSLPLAAVDLKTGWLNFPRPKTAIARRCSLWPETIAAIEAAIAERPAPNDPAHAGLLFVTRFGGPWAKVQSLPKRTVTKGNEQANGKANDEAGESNGTKAAVVDNPVTKEFRKLLDTLKLHRPGLGFYAIRHTFETIGGESRDQVAINAIMGHAPAANDMSSVYRERIGDDRLRAVAEHVRQWLVTDGRGKEAAEPASGWTIE